jgi:hypothetical protein
MSVNFTLVAPTFQVSDSRENYTKGKSVQRREAVHFAQDADDISKRARGRGRSDGHRRSK